MLLLFCGSASGAARFYTGEYTTDVIGGFELGSGGSLTRLPDSPYPALAPAAEPGGVWGLAFTPDGARAAAGFYFYGGAQGYSLDAAGRLLTAGAAVPSPSATGLAITPDGRFAYTPTRDFGGATAEGIVRYAVGANGALTRLDPPGGSGEYGEVAITPDGRFLFAAYLNRVDRFAIAPDGSLNFLGSTPAPSGQVIGVSPDGRFLFLIPGGGGELLASFATSTSRITTSTGSSLSRSPTTAPPA